MGAAIEGMELLLHHIVEIGIILRAALTFLIHWELKHEIEALEKKLEELEKNEEHA